MRSLKPPFLAIVVFLWSLSSYFATAESLLSSQPLEYRLDQFRALGEAERLHHLFDLYWDWRMAENPDEASYLSKAC